MSSTTPLYPSDTGIDPSCTVAQLITRAPATLPLLHQAGIDACCGGALPLAEAARRHGVALELLLEKLRTVLAPTP